MSKFDTARPYIAVYVLLRRDDGKVAFVKRSNTGWMDGKYGLPAGKVEKFETYLQAAVREAKEEVGVDIDPSDLDHLATIHRDAPDDKVDGDMSWVDILFEASKWQGEPYNAEPHMHSELAWLDINALPDTVIPVLADMIAVAESDQSYGEVEWGQR